MLHEGFYDIHSSFSRNRFKGAEFLRLPCDKASWKRRHVPSRPQKVVSGETSVYASHVGLILHKPAAGNMWRVQLGSPALLGGLPVANERRSCKDVDTLVGSPAEGITKGLFHTPCLWEIAGLLRWRIGPGREP